jgi:hypothetical protein
MTRKVDYSEFSEAFRTLMQWRPGGSEQMAAYRAFCEAGVMRALQDAMRFCEDVAELEGNEEVTLPKWLFGAAKNVVIERVEEGKSVGKGKDANDATKFKHAQMHLVRYLCVRRQMEAGLTLEDAYHPASALLKGTPAEGGADTIKKSYKKIRSALKDPPSAERIYPHVWVFEGWRG